MGGNSNPRPNFDRDLMRINLAMSIFSGMWLGKVIVLPVQQRFGTESEPP